MKLWIVENVGETISLVTNDTSVIEDLEGRQLTKTWEEL